MGVTRVLTNHPTNIMPQIIQYCSGRRYRFPPQRVVWFELKFIHVPPPPPPSPHWYTFLVKQTRTNVTSTNTESNGTISKVFKLNETYSITEKELMEMSLTV